VTLRVHSLMVAAQFSWSGQRTLIPAGQMVVVTLAQGVSLQPSSQVYFLEGHVTTGATKTGRRLSHAATVVHFGSALFDVHITLPRARQSFTSDLTFATAVANTALSALSGAMHSRPVLTQLFFGGHHICSAVHAAAIFDPLEACRLRSANSSESSA
jgi:hypothetical protein